MRDRVPIVEFEKGFFFSQHGSQIDGVQVRQGCQHLIPQSGVFPGLYIEVSQMGCEWAEGAPCFARIHICG